MTLFLWARKRKMGVTSPLDGRGRPNTSADRERVLSDEELVTVV